MAGWNRKDAENAFAGGGALVSYTALQIAKGKRSSGDWKRCVGKTSVANDAVERRGVERLLAWDTQRLRADFTGLSRIGLRGRRLLGCLGKRNGAKHA